MQRKSENKNLKDQKVCLGINQTISKGEEKLQQIWGIIITRRDVTRTRRTNSG